MVGLLDLVNGGGLLGMDDPAQARLWGLASGLLQAGGPSRLPVSLGQALGAGMQSSMAYGKQAAADRMEQGKSLMALQQLQLAQQKQQMLQSLFAGGEGQTGGPASAAQTPGQWQSLPADWRPSLALPRPPTVQPAGGQAQAEQQNMATVGQGSGGKPGLFDRMGLEHIAALHALAGVNLLPEYRLAKEGIPRKAGDYYQDPRTGGMTYMPKYGEGWVQTPQGMRLDPNYVQGNAAVEGAKVGAQEMAKVLPQVIQGQAALEGAKTGAQESAKAQVQYSPFVTQGMARQAGATTGAQEFAKAQYDLVPTLNAAGQTVPVPRARVLGTPGSGDQGGYISAPNPADVEYQKSVAGGAAKQYTGMQEEALQAPTLIAKYQQLGQLLEKHEGGALSQTGLHLAQLANSLGITIDKNLPNKEAALPIINQLALSLRTTGQGGGMPGALSDADRQFLVSSVPGLMQSAAGRKQIVQAQTSLLQRQMQTAKMARQWAQRYGRMDAVNPATGKDFLTNLQEWSNRNPLFGGGQ